MSLFAVVILMVNAFALFALCTFTSVVLISLKLAPFMVRFAEQPNALPKETVAVTFPSIDTS